MDQVPTLTASAVLPVKDRAEQLQKAIDSIFAQEFQVHQIIIVENNSDEPNRLREICESYNDSRIEFYSMARCNNANVARNYGLDKSNADITLFLDSDDIWYEDHVKNVVRLFKDKDVGFVYGAAVVKSGSDKIVKGSRNLSEGESPLDLILGWKGGYAQSSSFGLRTSLRDRLRWNEKLSRFQDYAMFVDAAKSTKVICNEKPDYEIDWSVIGGRRISMDDLELFSSSYLKESYFSTKLRFLLILIKSKLVRHHIGIKNIIKNVIFC